MMFVRTLVLCTKSYNEMTVLTPRVEEIVLESGVQEGMVTVLTRHDRRDRQRSVGMP